MEEKKENCFVWIREHKKELIIAGISVGATMALFFGLKNRTLLEEKFEVLRNVVEDVTEKSQFMEVLDEGKAGMVENAPKAITRAPHDVCMHPRMLSGERKASSQALAYAKEIGYPLLPGQTLVKAYHTGGKAA